MSRTSKLRSRAALSKRTKGQHKGEDKRRKGSAPHQQSKPDWAIPKSQKGKGRNRVVT